MNHPDTEERTDIVSTDFNKPSQSLLHVHTCIHCGNALKREVFEDRALTSGIFHCSKCGLEGPLNVEIREMDEQEPSG